MEVSEKKKKSMFSFKDLSMFLVVLCGLVKNSK